MEQPMFFSRCGKLYEIAGYYSLHDRDDLFYSHEVHDYVPAHFAIQRKIKRACDYYDTEVPAELLEFLIFKSFGLDLQKCFKLVATDNKRLFVVFKQTLSIVDIFAPVEKDPEIYIYRHLMAGNKIHRLRSNITSVIDFCSPYSRGRQQERMPITLSSIGRVTHRFDSPEQRAQFEAKQAASKKSKQKSFLSNVKMAHQNKERNALPPITLEEGYDNNLIVLRKAICKQAELNGGFIEFDYGGMTLVIPKAPMLQWAASHRQEKGPQTWISLSPVGLKIEADNPCHSDWWIGAGLPVDAYCLGSRGFIYHQLDKMLCDLAFEQEAPKKTTQPLHISEKTTEQLHYYVGGTACAESEMRIIAESYVGRGAAKHLPIFSIINTLELKGFAIKQQK